MLADIAVDSFFAISGFLICRAWHRRPDLGRFLLARGRRILPGLWACLLVTAFVVAPLAAWIAGTAGPSQSGKWHYVLANAGTWVQEWGIDGGPVGLPQPGVWNGSLWSLGYEAGCYMVVAFLGVTRLLRPMVVAGIAVTCWMLSVMLVAEGVGASGNFSWVVPRCGLMFSCGALLWMHRDKVRVSPALTAAATGCVLVGAMTPNYRLLAAPAIAYLCLAAGLALGQRRRLVLHNDLSYGVYVYGFPIQQALLLVGVRLGWFSFAALSLGCVLPAAALSWFLVEKPMSKVRRRPPNSEPVQRPVHRDAANAMS